MSINEKIKTVYKSPEGFGSIRDTFNQVRKKYPDDNVKYEQVKEWFNKEVPRLQKMKGDNSYVAPEPLHEFQVDMFWYKNKQTDYPTLKEQTGKKYTAGVNMYGLLAIDSFTKYVWVVPLDRKLQSSWTSALEQIFDKMGKPKTIYADPDSTLLATNMSRWLKNRDVELITTKNHANIAERAIRTIKSMLDKRVDDNPGAWTRYLPDVLSKYNKSKDHSSIGMSPEEATKPQNEFEVRTNLEIHRRHNRKYPPLEVGDKVRLFKKRGTFGKEREGWWEDGHRTVKAVEEKFGQKHYTLDNLGHKVIRADMYKI